jgi:hypothetical protein
MEKIKSHPWLNGETATVQEIKKHYTAIKKQCKIDEAEKEERHKELQEFGIV